MTQSSNYSWLWLALLAFLFFAYWPGKPPSPGPTQPVNPAPDSGVRPGDHVPWFPYPAQKQLSDSSWGAWLTDIENHLPASSGKQYRASDPTTWAHETTHGIHAHLRNTYGKPGQNAFYVGSDKAVIISEPKVTISQVAALVPASLRGSRYRLYLVQQARQWNSQPLYLFDEWVAYTNGALAALEDASRKGTDDCVAPLEFVSYALTLTLAIEKHDPSYLSSEDGPIYREFLAHELRRAIGGYRRGMSEPRLHWDNKLEVTLRTGSEANPLRELLSRLYGREFTLDSLFQ